MKFIRDVTGLGEIMIKVYSFRHRVKHSQKFVEEFIEMKFHRLQLLWKALEREEMKLQADVVAQNARKLKRSRQTVTHLRGLGDTARMIDSVSSSLEKVR